LWAESCAEVNTVLRTCGYTLGEPLTVGNRRVSGHLSYPIYPGDATLRAVKNPDEGSVKFVFDGQKFGKATAAGVTDPVVWMQLVQLGFQLARTYVIEPQVWDPGTDDPPLEYPSARLN
jgi:hypothetical protein